MKEFLSCVWVGFLFFLGSFLAASILCGFLAAFFYFCESFPYLAYVFFGILMFYILGRTFKDFQKLNTKENGDEWNS